MKKLLWILLASVAVVGCKKKNVDHVSPADDNEIKIGATQGSISKAVDNTGQFNMTSKIGVYSVEKSKFATDAFTAPLQANVGYGYAGHPGGSAETTPSNPWTPIGSTVLNWQFQVTPPTNAIPVVLVAYHPYDANLENATAPKRDGDEIEFTIAKDQSASTALNGADLMWAASTGKNGSVYENLEPGYSNVNGSGIFKSNDQGQAIDLKFHHMLTKLNFKVGFYKTVSAGEEFTSPILKKIEVTGAQITNSGKLNLRTGEYTAKANTAPNIGDSHWTGSEPYTATVGTNKVVPAGDFQEICEVITAPATFGETSTDNQLKFYVEYTYKKDAAAPVETLNKTYTFTLNKITLGGNDSFKRNQQNNFKVTLNLSSNEIFITSTIKEWTGVDYEIEGN